MRPGFATITSLSILTLTSSVFAQGGDDAVSAVPIAVPGSDTGTTVGFTNEADEACPYAGSTAPDVWYRYSPPASEFISVDLCESGYDTKVYVYDQNLAPVIRPVDGDPACNDDACSSSGGGGFRSFIDCVPVSAGATYFIVVDGWSGAAGPYAIVTGLNDPASCAPAPPCILEQPPDAIVENEPCDFGNTQADDLFNGGCTCSKGPAGCFSHVACGDVVWGRGYFDGARRDTDWFAIDISDYEYGVIFDVDAIAEFGCIVLRVENGAGALDCSQVTSFAEFTSFDPCEPASLTSPVLVGTEVWYTIGHDFTAIETGLTNCNDPDPADPRMWGADYIISFACTVIAPPCVWDIDGSGEVDFLDFIGLLANWGPIGGGSAWDFDGDGMVGLPDLLAMLSNWGPCP